jgi:hypothetical protein
MTSEFSQRIGIGLYANMLKNIWRVINCQMVKVLWFVYFASFWCYINPITTMISWLQIHYNLFKIGQDKPQIDCPHLGIV